MHQYRFINNYIIEGTPEMYAEHNPDGTIIGFFKHRNHEIRLVLEYKDNWKFSSYYVKQSSRERLREIKLKLNYSKTPHPISLEYELFRIMNHVTKESLGEDVILRKYSISDIKKFHENYEVIFEKTLKMVQEVKDPSLPLQFSFSNDGDILNVYAYYDIERLTQGDVSEIFCKMEPKLIKILK